MIHIDNVALYGGASARGPVVNTDVVLKTEEGKHYFDRKIKLFEVARSNRKLPEYQDFLRSEFTQIEKQITDFVYDDKMVKKYKMNDTDEEGWHIYHEMVDKYEVCKYLMNKKATFYDR